MTNTRVEVAGTIPSRTRCPPRSTKTFMSSQLRFSTSTVVWA